MTAFTQHEQVNGTHVDFESTPPEPVKSPPRWSLTNWPVRWKVLAIVLVPLVLAGVLGGLRIYSGATEAADLRRAADRAELIPDISSYMAALEGAMVASTEGGETQSSLAQFDTRKSELRQRLESDDVVPDVRSDVTTLLDNGQDMLDKVVSNSIDLRQRVTTYAPLLLTAENAITESVRSDDPEVRLQAEALSRAIGARGQMAMQELLVGRGGDLPEPELRTSLITLAGTEPSTIAGMAKLLGGASDQASTLRSEMVKRMSLLSDPAVGLVGNQELLQSQQTTAQIANELIADNTSAVPVAVDQAANAQRNTAIRDAVLVLAGIVSALLIVLFVARSLVRPLRTLRDSALKVAHDDLAWEIEWVRAGREPGPVEPIPVYTTEEVGQVAHAVDELHEQAVFLAGEQARLQLQVTDMFETLSRRSRSLVDQQLSLIDHLERNEENPERLDSLFHLDHLAARMRRNGANLLVLAGATIAPEQAEPVAVAAIINAAASEVEDYTRVVTVTVPDSEILGSAASDLVHVLAELLDNALRYSPPISEVQVSAVHTEDGRLVIEVSDIGLGMTESDLRVANTRLQSGGEVNPHTARHMGLFVVGRLAAQHGSVVRLRSTIAGEPNSGTTAEVYVPAELILGADVPGEGDAQSYGTPVDANSGIATALALDEEHGDYAEYRDALPGEDYDALPGEDYDALPGEDYIDRDWVVPAGLLPQRNPGASGISATSTSLATPGAEQPTDWSQEWPSDSMPTQTIPAVDVQPAQVDSGNQVPADTSAFFASRAQAARNDVHEVSAGQPQPAEVARHVAHTANEPSPTAGVDDAIYQNMLSEWLINPTELANSSDLNWDSVWDHGWSAAAAAEDAPVLQRTEEGLPMRDPGARLVPGAVDPDGLLNAGRRSSGAHRKDDGDDEVASAAGFESGAESLPLRDPGAAGASISNHFGGVQAGRSHARETKGTDTE